MQSIYHFQKRLSNRLLAWSAVSFILGLLMQKSTSANWRGFGQQAATWAAIDAAIAAAGWNGSNKKQDDPNAYAPAEQQKERTKLGRLLWINAGLDLFYMIGGLTLARRDDPKGKGWFGHGWGIVIQGAFLFLFDLIHAMRLPTIPSPIISFSAKPFSESAGQSKSEGKPKSEGQPKSAEQSK